MAHATIVLLAAALIAAATGPGPALAQTSPVLLVSADGSTLFSTCFPVGGAPVAVLDPAGFTLEDADTGTLSAVTARLTDACGGAAEGLSASTARTQVVLQYDPASGLLSMTGTRPVAEYARVLSSLVYFNTATPAPCGLTTGRTILFTVTNPNGLTSARNTVDIAFQLDPPTLGLTAAAPNNAAVAFVEGGLAILLADPAAASITVDSRDASGTLDGLTVVLSNTVDGTALELIRSPNTAGLSRTVVPAADGLSVSYTFVFTGATSPGTVAEYQALLRALRYQNMAAEPTAQPPRVASIFVSDGKQDSAAVNATIAISTINDNTPAFVTPAPAGLTLTENTLGTTNLTVVAAADADSGLDGVTAFSLADDFGGAFAVTSPGGVVQAVQPVDREAVGDLVVLEVVVSDLGQPALQASQRISLAVLDLNDNAPAFVDPELDVVFVPLPLPAPAGAAIADFAAADPDATTNGAVTYALSPGPGVPAALFAVDAQGVLRVSDPALFPSPADAVGDAFLVSVTATDGGSPALSTTRASTVRPGLAAPVVDLNGLAAAGVDTAVRFASGLSASVPLVDPASLLFVRGSTTDFLSSATATLQARPDGDATEGLSASSPSAAIGVSYTPSTGVLTFTGRASSAEYAAAMATTRYFSLQAGRLPTAGARTVAVQVVDASAATTASAVATASVLVFDHAIAFAAPLTATATEGAAPATPIATLQAVYADAQTPGPPAVVFSLEDATLAGTFVVDPDSGDVLVIAPLDRDSVGGGLLSVAVRATHRLFPSLVADATLLVEVLDVNDNAPVVPSFTAQVDETAPANTVVATVQASDADAGANAALTFSLAPTQAPFALGAADGVLTTSGALDFETQPRHDLDVIVTDGGGLSTPATVTVLVNNVNEAPTAVLLSATQVAETALPATVVGTLSTADPDMGDAGLHLYTLLDSAGGLFSISSGNSLVVAAPLDFEASPTHTVVVRSSDPLGLSTTASFLITVLNRNDAPTDIVLQNFVAGPNANLTIPESTAVGARIADLFAVDQDLGQLAVFFIDAQSPAGVFGISARELLLAAPLDFETGPLVSVTIRARDSGSPPLEVVRAFTFLVGDDNEAPIAVFLSPAAPTVAEDAAAGTQVAEVVAYDFDAENLTLVGADLGPFALGASVSCTRILAAAARLPLAGVDAGSAVTECVAPLEVGGPLDFEASPSHTVTVMAADAGSLGAAGTFTVLVSNVDEPPVVLLPGNTVDENLPASTSIGCVAAADPEGQPVSCSISPGSSLLFGLVDTPSRTCPFVLVTAAVLDADTAGAGAPPTAAEVVCSDGTTNVTTAFAITVRNLNEAPFAVQLTPAVVAENAEGVLVGVLTTSDPDAADTHIYTVLGDSPFEVDGDLLRVRAGRPLDFEAASTVTVQVRTEDSGTPPLSDTLAVEVRIVDVNERPTDILLSESMVSEALAVGQPIATLQAVDPDVGDSHTFSVAGRDAGFVSVANAALLLAVPLDFEALPALELTLRVVDGGLPSGLSFSRAVTLTVLDANDGPTDLLLDNSRVAENSAAGTVVGVLSVVDPDARDAHKFALLADGGGLFAIEGVSLVVAGALDFEAQGSVAVTVEAKDSGGGTVERSFTITILDANDPPVVTLTRNTVAEGSGANELVGLITAVDQDAGTDTSIAISLGGVAQAAFALEAGSQSCQTLANPAVLSCSAVLVVSGQQALDHEATPELPLTIFARDSSGATAQLDATILVTDQPERPVVTLLRPGVTYAEGTPAGTFFPLLGTVAVVEQDSMMLLNATLVLRPAPDSDFLRFSQSVAPLTGSFMVGAGNSGFTLFLEGLAPVGTYQAAIDSLVYENPETAGEPTGGIRTLSVAVADEHGPSNTASVGLLVTLINDNAPVIDAALTNATAELPGLNLTREALAQVVATDADRNDVLLYSIVQVAAPTVVSTPSPSACYQGPSDGRDYRGQVNTTASGLTCQSWAAQSPHAHRRDPEVFPDMGLGDHNFCRNPDREGSPWCYTTSSDVLFELCDVCADPAAPELLQDLGAAELAALFTIDELTGTIRTDGSFEQLRGLAILTIEVSDQGLGGSAPQTVQTTVELSIVDPRPGDATLVCRNGVLEGLDGGACSCAAGPFCSACSVDRVTLGFVGCLVCNSNTVLAGGACLGDCTSLVGFEVQGAGPEGRECVAINNCERGVCGANSACTFLGPGESSCACNTNFTGLGNGTACEAINPCLTNGGGCAANTICVLTGPNQRRCDCQAGLEPSGLGDGMCVLTEETCLGGVVFPNSGAGCSCGPSCFGCTNTIVDSACDTCQGGQYLFAGACHANCSAFPGTVEVGLQAFGRRCEVVSTAGPTTPTTTAMTPVTCFGTQTLDGLACSCPTSCAACTVIRESAVRTSSTCDTCGDSLFLLAGACVGSCPPTHTGVGDSIFGRVCEDGTTTATTSPTTTPVPVCTGRADSNGRLCSCDLGCAQCLLAGPADKPCLTCGGGLFLAADACHADCAAFPGTTAVPGPGGVGGECA